jgi:hypothetical protein
VMEGQIVQLAGQQFVARLRDTSGTHLDVRADINIDSQTGGVTGTMSASSAGGG